MNLWPKAGEGKKEFCQIFGGKEGYIRFGRIFKVELVPRRMKIKHFKNLPRTLRNATDYI